MQSVNNMQGLIDIGEFMAHLEQNGFVVAHKSRVKGALPPTPDEVMRLQHSYMKRKAITITEIVQARLLPLTSKEGVQDWIKRKIILDQEVLRGTDSKKTIKIATAAIRRLGYWQ